MHNVWHCTKLFVELDIKEVLLLLPGIDKWMEQTFYILCSGVHSMDTKTIQWLAKESLSAPLYEQKMQGCMLKPPQHNPLVSVPGKLVTNT